MIVLPPLLASAGAFLKTVFVSASLSGVVGGGAGAAGEVINGVQTQGEINHAIVEKAASSAVNGAAQGALVGGAFGGVTALAAPAFAAAGGGAGSVIGLVDDAAKPVIGVIDDVTRPIMNAVDDIAGPHIRTVQHSVDDFGRLIGSGVNYARNAIYARFYRQLPKATGKDGYVYLMDDAANGAHKIGRTNHPSRRLPEVERATGKQLNYTCIIPAINPGKLERALHATFADARLPNSGIGREWFNLSPAQVTQACSQ